MRRRTYDKDELRAEVKAEHENVLRTLDSLPDEAAAMWPIHEMWSAKDLLGHLTAWGAISLERIRTVRRGEPVKRLFRDDEDADALVDKLNAAEVERRKAWPLADARKEYEQTLTELLTEMDKLGQEQFDAHLGEGWPEEYTLGLVIRTKRRAHAGASPGDAPGGRLARVFDGPISERSRGK